MFHMLIGIGYEMTPIEFEFTSSNVKVTRGTLLINYVNSLYWASYWLKSLQALSPYPFTSGQSSHFYNMNLFIKGSLYISITLLSKPFLTMGQCGGYICRFRWTFLVNIKVKKIVFWLSCSLIRHIAYLFGAIICWINAQFVVFNFKYIFKSIYVSV